MQHVRAGRRKARPSTATKVYEALTCTSSFAFLAFSSDFLFAACRLFTISDPSFSFWQDRKTRGSTDLLRGAEIVACVDSSRVTGAAGDGGA